MERRKRVRAVGSRTLAMQILIRAVWAGGVLEMSSSRRRRVRVERSVLWVMW